MAKSPVGEVHHRTAVVGSPVSHSLSPVPHRAIYVGFGLDDRSYERRETDSEALSALFTGLAAPVQAGPAWAGLGATMSYKQILLACLDIIDLPAEAVGAVNAAVAQRSGAGSVLLTDFNTDAVGIVGALREVTHTQAPDCPDGCLRIGQAVVLGSGATTYSALTALGEFRAGQIAVVTRRHAGPGRALSAVHRMGLNIETLTWKPSDSASNTEAAWRLAAADVTTSILPAHAADPLVHPLRRALDQTGGIHPGAVMLDVVYAPQLTAAAGAWAHTGGVPASGWLMFLHQAVPQVQLMTGQQPDIDLMCIALLAAIAPTADTSTTAH